MISSRKQACDVLGVSVWAGESEIKKAYRNLAKVYHPDAGEMADLDKYALLTEAYDYLMASATRVVPGNANTKIIGNTGNSFYKNSNYSSFEAKHKRQQAARQRQVQDEMLAKAKESREKKQQYDNAMKAINSIIAAEVLKKMIKDNDAKEKEAP